MSAFEVVYMTGKSGAVNCLEPRENGAACLGSASVKVSINGWPWERMCRKHAAEAQRIWDEMSGVESVGRAAA